MCLWCIMCYVDFYWNICDLLGDIEKFFDIYVLMEGVYKILSEFKVISR